MEIAPSELEVASIQNDGLRPSLIEIAPLVLAWIGQRRGVKCSL
jgi:hypothetical protein